MRRLPAYGLLLSVASLGAACCSHTKATPSATTPAAVKPSTKTGAILDGSTSGHFRAEGHVSRDPNGWTVGMPSSDSRIIYVSSSRGNDRHDGRSEGRALKTLAV